MNTISLLNLLNSKRPESTIQFTLKPGTKYTKIIDHHQAIHCFIDSELNVYKPHGQKPNKLPRFNLITDHDFLINNADIFGIYLYK